MTAPEILHELTAMGVRIDVREGQLHVKAPVGILTPQVQERIRSVKPHLVEHLAGAVTHRKATPTEQCQRCRELEAQGIRVLHCSECHRELRPTG